MNDPLSPLTAPPPRYLLESDSSDEEGEGQYPGSTSSTRISRKDQKRNLAIAFSGNSDVDPLYENVMVGAGQAGKYLARISGNDAEEETVKIMDGGRRIGRGWKIGKSLVIDVEDTDVRSGWEVAGLILARFKAEQWIIVSTYLPALYIPDTSSKVPSTPPIRYLNIAGQSTVQADSMERYTSPNYVAGLAGAFGALASHPSSPISSAEGVTLYLLPLPLSSINTQCLLTLFQVVGVDTTRSGGWAEEDDEPYVGPGMGKDGSNMETRIRPGEETGGMYM